MWSFDAAPLAAADKLIEGGGLPEEKRRQERDLPAFCCCRVDGYFFVVMRRQDPYSEIREGRIQDLKIFAKIRGGVGGERRERLIALI